MSEQQHIAIADLTVEVVRKRIRNLRIGVYPPLGRVRVAAPLAASDDAIRLAVVGKLAWIRRHRHRFQQQPRQSARQMVSGEYHYVLGRQYQLQVHESPGPSRVAVRDASNLDLFIRPGTATAQREAVLLAWYREQLQVRVPGLLEKWEPMLRVKVAQWGIKRMKTRWGSCNYRARRIWLNLELARRPPGCLEYVLVHELVHLHHHRHDTGFFAAMDRHLPQWRQTRSELNRSPAPI